MILVNFFHFQIAFFTLISMAPNIFNDSISTSKCVVNRSRINLKNVNGLSDFVPRPGHGKAGKKIFLMSNHFPVEFNPDLAIYHYDVAIECLPQPLKIVAADKTHIFHSSLFLIFSCQLSVPGTCVSFF